MEFNRDFLHTGKQPEAEKSETKMIVVEEITDPEELAKIRKAIEWARIFYH